jgi:hypothetical protein
MKRLELVESQWHVVTVSTTATLVEPTPHWWMLMTMTMVAHLVIQLNQESVDVNVKNSSTAAKLNVD